MTTKHMTCICCPFGCEMEVSAENNEVYVTGSKCEKGNEYAKTEILYPRRVLTTTVRCTINGKKIIAPVKTKGDIPKELLFQAMNVINGIELNSPLKMGDVVFCNILDTGVDIVLTDDLAT